MHFELKDGSRVLFWHDFWCVDRPLKNLFPDLFRMARLKYVKVQEVVSWNGDISHWNLTFVRSLNDWEEDNICNLLALLASKEVFPQGNDEIVLPLNYKGSFSLKSFCSTQFEALNGRDFVAKSIWKSKAPTKVCFFAWVATIGKIHMEDMLKRRNFSGPSRCSMCLEEEETVDHLLVPCRWVSSLWYLSLSLMRITWRQPSNVRYVVVASRRRIKKSWVLQFGVWFLWLFGGYLEGEKPSYF